MKNTKLFGRIVCLILAVVMCLSLAACGSSGQSGTANTKKIRNPRLSMSIPPSIRISLRTGKIT